MWSIRRSLRTAGYAALTGAGLVLVSSWMTSVEAQQGHGSHGRGPLVLKEQGMFYLPGDIVHTDAANAGNLPGFDQSGDIAVNQMYVGFMRPQNERGVPIILTHGGNLSGACYETTPDGRMGWYEYFARQGHAVYLPDQVSRGRSGFNVTPFNEVAAGTRPPTELPTILVVTKKASWESFRFGPSLGTAFPGEQFPVEAIDALAEQSIPDQNAEFNPPAVNLTPTRLAELGAKIGGAVLMGHSESGFYPELAALQNPAGLRGLISIEAPACAPGLGNVTGGGSTLSPAQIAKLAKIPTLVVFGDHLDDASTSSTVNWPAALASCQKYVDAINQAGGDATMLHLPDAGVFGNSHMLFQDKNNLQVGDLVLAWIDQHVGGKPPHSK
jgi:pimeloyl-ACP methyl ester carboxylesterase